MPTISELPLYENALTETDFFLVDNSTGTFKLKANSVGLPSGINITEQHIGLGDVTVGDFFSIGIGFNATSTGQYATAIGSLATANAFLAIAIGQFTSSNNNSAIVIGAHGTASGEKSIQIGSDGAALGYAAINIGEGSAPGDFSVATRTIARLDDSIISRGFHTVKMDDWNDQNEVYTSAPEIIIMSPNQELGVPETWQAGHEYKNGDIVQPTVPNGFQYRLVTADDETNKKRKTTDISTSEPAWTTTIGVSSFTDNWNEWICQQPSTGYQYDNFPNGSIFVPREFGFVCHKFSALSGTITASVGTISNPTKYADNEPMNITEVYDNHVFTMISKAGIDENEQLQFTLNTAATAGQCNGRWYVRGFFVERPDHQ